MFRRSDDRETLLSASHPRIPQFDRLLQTRTDWLPKPETEIACRSCPPVTSSCRRCYFEHVTVRSSRRLTRLCTR